LASRFRRQIQYIEESNRGPASARNAAIRIGHGDYLFSSSINSTSSNQHIQKISLLYRSYLIVFLLTLPCEAFIAEGAIAQHVYYISPQGDDNNPGSLSQPFKTIERARKFVRTINTNMQSTIVVYLRGGDYLLDKTLVFDQGDSGTSGFNVIYKAYPGEKPVISGGQRITKWTAAGDGIYKAPVGSLRFRQLYINGRRAIRAREPNQGNYYRLKYWDEVNRRIEIVATHTGAWDRLNDIEMVVQKHWYQNNLRISSYTLAEKWYDVFARWGLPVDFLSLATRSLLTSWILKLQNFLGVDLGVRALIVPREPERWRSFFQTFPQREDGQPYHLENALEFLDAPGEWYLDTGRNALFYRPRPAEDMSVVEVIAPKVETLLELKGSLDRPIRNLEFAGLIFEYTNWLGPSAEGFVGDQAVVTLTGPHSLTGDETEYYIGGRLSGGIHAEASERIRFERNTVRHMGASGIVLEFGTMKSEIIGNVVTDISGSGIVVEQHLEGNPKDRRMISRGDKIANNYISRIGQDYHGNVGILAGYTDGILIEHNELSDMPYTGISVGWGWSLKDTALKNNVIRRNQIYNAVNTLDDGAGIYTLSKQPGTLISENYIHDIKRSPWAGLWPIAGIYLDNGSDLITVENNVLKNVEKKIHLNLGTPAGSNNQFRNNDGESVEVMANAGLELQYRDIRTERKLGVDRNIGSFGPENRLAIVISTFAVVLVVSATYLWAVRRRLKRS
jgi:hypothetical protein